VDDPVDRVESAGRRAVGREAEEADDAVDVEEEDRAPRDVRYGGQVAVLPLRLFVTKWFTRR
jgi:hypothetical protein